LSERFSTVSLLSFRSLTFFLPAVFFVVMIFSFSLCGFAVSWPDVSRAPLLSFYGGAFLSSHSAAGTRVDA
jgi:hypothetical protein